MSSSDSTLAVTINSGGESAITVRKCAVLNGVLNLTLDSPPPAKLVVHLSLQCFFDSSSSFYWSLVHLYIFFAQFSCSCLLSLSQVMTYGCVNGTLSSVQTSFLSGALQDSCTVYESTPLYTNSSLAVLFKVSNKCDQSMTSHPLLALLSLLLLFLPSFSLSTSCSSPPPLGIDDTTFLILVTVIPIVGVLLIATIIVVLTVPKLRARIFPYRDRTSTIAMKSVD